MRRVYIDESLHTSVGICILSAVTIDTSVEGAARSDLALLLPTGAKRLHWQQNGTVLRDQSIQVVANRALQARAYMSYFDSNKRGDAARERCLIHMLSDLGGPPINELVIDQRSPHQDTRDDDALTSHAQRLRLPNPPSWRHSGSLTESLLWLADAVAGAVSEHVVNSNAAFVQKMASKLVIA